MNFLVQRQEIASRLRLDQADSTIDTLLKRWINAAQSQIWTAYDWPWALDREIVQMVIDKTAGTVDVSAGGTTVTGTSTSFAAADVGKYIQFSSSNDWYRITAQASATSLTIGNAYVGTSALTGGTYRIRKIFYSLSSSVEKLLSVKQTVGPDYLELVQFNHFDIFDPHPTKTGPPNMAMVFGFDSSGNVQFTPYPFPDVAMNLECRLKKRVTELSGDADTSALPLPYRSTIMLDGALVRGYEYLGSGGSKDDTRAFQMRRIFMDGIERMKAECEPDAAAVGMIRSREQFNATAGPRLPPKYER